MATEPSKSGNIVPMAAGFEASLALVAVLLGWIFATKPLATLTWDPLAIAWGLLAAVPMFLLLAVMVWVPWGPFGRLLRLVDDMVLTLFSGATLFDLALISLMAGIGEELLFRGFVQAGLVKWTGSQLAALLGAGALFGLMHSITRTYAVLAAVVGVYLGWVWMATGNLLAPIVAHAVYDFGALCYLKHSASRRISGSD